MELILLLPLSCRPPSPPSFYFSLSVLLPISLSISCLEDTGRCGFVPRGEPALVLPSFPLLSQHTGHKQIMNHPRTPRAECIVAEVGGGKEKVVSR